MKKLFATIITGVILTGCNSVEEISKVEEPLKNKELVALLDNIAKEKIHEIDNKNENINYLTFVKCERVGTDCNNYTVIFDEKTPVNMSSTNNIDYIQERPNKKVKTTDYIHNTVEEGHYLSAFYMNGENEEKYENENMKSKITYKTSGLKVIFEEKKLNGFKTLNSNNKILQLPEFEVKRSVLNISQKGNSELSINPESGVLAVWH